MRLTTVARTSTQKVPLSERKTICLKFVEAMEKRKPEIAKEITMQMGRYMPEHLCVAKNSTTAVNSFVSQPVDGRI